MKEVTTTTSWYIIDSFDRRWGGFYFADTDKARDTLAEWNSRYVLSSPHKVIRVTETTTTETVEEEL